VQRVWLVAGIVVVVVAATAILLNRDAGGEKKAEPVRQAPTRLTEHEVRTYIDVMPRFHEVLQEAANQFQNRPKNGTTDNGVPDPRAKITALLRRHHLDLKSWDVLRRRVEYVVTVVRFENSAEEREAALDEAIAQKEQLVSAASGSMKKTLEEDLKNLEAQRNARGAPIQEEDRELALRFWPDLDRLTSGTASGLEQRPPR
jgi:hypothetical protein